VGECSDPLWVTLSRGVATLPPNEKKNQSLFFIIVETQNASLNGKSSMFIGCFHGTKERLNAQKSSEGNTITSEDTNESPQQHKRRKADKGDRHYAFTSFEENPPTFEHPMKYLIYGKEVCPTSGRMHWQCYTYLQYQKTVSAMRRLLPNIHIEPMLPNSTPEANITYCKKGNDFKEFGTPPEQGRRHDLEELVDQVLHGEVSVDTIVQESPLSFHQYGRTLERAETIYLRSRWRTERTTGYWICGESGSGKSHAAFNTVCGKYHPDTHYNFSYDGDWWDGYKQQDTVIFNEFRGQLPYSKILTLTDEWPDSCRRRNMEAIPFISKTIIVTSVMLPNKIYKNLAKEDDLRNPKCIAE